MEDSYHFVLQYINIDSHVEGIVAALSYMNVIEAWGSGIPRMFREAQEYGVVELKNGIGVNDTNSNGTDMGWIVHLIQLNPKIRQREITEKTGISLSTVKRIMAKLQKEGKIERKGSNRFGEWIIRK